MKGLKGWGKLKRDREEWVRQRREVRERGNNIRIKEGKLRVNKKNKIKDFHAKNGAVNWNESNRTSSKTNPTLLVQYAVFWFVLSTFSSVKPCWVILNLLNVLPGVDKVLGHADTGWRASDRDLAHG